DQPFHPITRTINSPIEWSGPALIPPAGNGVANMALAQVAANLPTAVGFVTDHAPWAQAGPPAANPLDRALRHHLFEHHRFVALAGRQDEGHGLAAAFGPDVDLGAEAALAAAQRLGIRRGVTGTRRVLMGAHHRAIDIVRLPIDPVSRVGRLLKGFPNLLPNPLFTPTVEATGKGGPLAVAVGNIAPGCAGALEPQNAIHNR